MTDELIKCRGCNIHSDCEFAIGGYCTVYAYSMDQFKNTKLTYCPQYDRSHGLRKDLTKTRRIRVTILAVLEETTTDDEEETDDDSEKLAEDEAGWEQFQVY